MPTTIRPRRGDTEDAVVFAFFVIVAVGGLLIWGGIALYNGGYRNGQIDVLSGTLTKFEEITLENGKTGWVDRFNPEKVYRTEPDE